MLRRRMTRAIDSSPWQNDSKAVHPSGVAIAACTSAGRREKTPRRRRPAIISGPSSRSTFSAYAESPPPEAATVPAHIPERSA